MKRTKENLKTIRLTEKEEALIKTFLKEHPYLRTFSTMVRAALWDFLKAQRFKKMEKEGRPSFLWEYRLSGGEIQEILSGPRENRLWLVAKILEHGNWEEIWTYLTLDQIESDMPFLRLPKKTKQHWDDAIRRWRRVA